MMRLLGSACAWCDALVRGVFRGKGEISFAGAGRAGTRNPASAKPDCLSFRSSDGGSGKHRLEGRGA